MRARHCIAGLIAIAALGAACTSDPGVTTVAVDSTAPSTERPDTTSPDSTEAPTDTTAPPETPVGDLVWEECDDPEVSPDDGLECATLTVPLDYGDQNGETLDLALVRAPALSDREGAILFNPGGPGGSGFDYIAGGGTFVQSAMGLESFDIIGFDPRGVDRSNGIRCMTDAEQDKYLYVDYTPDTPEEQALFDESDGVYEAGCLRNYGDTLQFYSTENTARDMDAIRAALGDDQMSFLGVSYGTYLGATYATLFPDRVRAMVLDSAYEPNGDTVEQQYETQLVGFEEAFNNFADWCETNTDCAFNAPDVGARWDALLERLDQTPVPADDGREGNNAVMSRATTAALYSDSQWPVLATALLDAEAGDPTGIFALADDYNGRNPDGTFNTLFQSFSVITCASGIEAQTPDDPEALAERLRTLAPRFGKDIVAEDFTEENESCATLVGDAQSVELDYSGDGPIVVIGGLNDPATPIRWAEEMTAALGPNAEMVTYTGEGHGQLLTSTCVTDIQANLLVFLELPPSDTVCDPDPAIERPDWWGDVPTPDGVSEVVPLSATFANLGIIDTEFFAEGRTTALSAQDAADAYEAALTAAGFEPLGFQDLGIPDTTNGAYFAPNGDLLLIVTLGPEAYLSEDLQGAAGDVEPGQTAVLVLYLVQ